MKKTVFLSAATLLAASTLTSCYVNTFNVGKGAQSSAEIRRKNHYFVEGLVPAGVSDPARMAGGSGDYTVTILHTFFDGLLSFATFGIYTPTTTIVRK